MTYNEGDSIKIKGQFICEFKDSFNNLIKVEDKDRSFTFLIKHSDIINTNLNYNTNDIVKIEDWLREPVNSKGKTSKQIPKIKSEFLEKYIKDEIITEELFDSLKELHELKIYRGDVIDTYFKLLNCPYEIFVKAIFNLEKKKNKIDYLFSKLFKKHISNESLFMPFEAGNVLKGYSGVYFFTCNEKVVYVGKSSDFQVEYNGYKSSRVQNSFPNNKGTRGKINMKIAEKANNNINQLSIKWYNMSEKSTNIDYIFDNLEKKGVNIKNTFKLKKPNDFFETLIMSVLDVENWNNNKGGFDSLIKIT